MWKAASIPEVTLFSAMKEKLRRPTLPGAMRKSVGSNTTKDGRCQILEKALLPRPASSAPKPNPVSGPKKWEPRRVPP